MKILVISTVGLAASGITTVIKNYYSRIDKGRFEVAFVFPKVTDKYLLDEFESWGKVYILKRTIKTLPQYILGLRRLVKENKYDIVHVHGNSATMVFEMMGTALGGIKVRIVHSHSSACSSITMHRLLNPLFGKLYTHAFACGEKSCEWLFGKGNARIINNGVDLSRFKFDISAREKLKKELNFDGKTVIGHIGNFYKCKNHRFLINIFESLYRKDPNSHLVLVGDGETREKIESLTEQKGLKRMVTFVGAVDNANEFYQVFDAFVLPSLFEGMPLVSIEAQASGLPCIIADTVSKETKVTDLVEFLSLENSAEKWADAILSAVKGNKRDEKSEKAVKDLTTAGFDIVKNVKDLEKVYEEMLKK